MEDSGPGAAHAQGLLASLRRLGATTVELLRTRVELIATEIDEERDRITRLLVLSAIAGFLLALGIVMLTFFIIILAWDTHRILATAILTVTYLGAGVLAALKARAAAKEATKLFSASLAQLTKDRDALTS
jgi:uncharacterized membrane protein YqjE